MKKFSTATAVVVVAGVVTWLTVHHRSARHHRWHPGAGDTYLAGRLSVRVFGTGESVIVLLHGLAASQAYFGTAYDRLEASSTVVVPDLLGFGMSQPNGDSHDGDFSLDSQCAAIEQSIQALNLAARPILVVGHSMGSTLAIALAARGTLDVRGVIAFNAPLYRTRDEAEQHVHSMGWFEAILSSGPLAHAVCAWMCRHRATAGLLSIIISPRLPVRIALDGVRHSWPSYIQSFETVVESAKWEQALASLASKGIPVDLANGDSDPVPVVGRAQELKEKYDNVSDTHREGDHDMPLVHAEWCTDFIMGHLNSLFHARVPSDPHN